VRGTGGLRDTVLSYNKYNGEGNGFTFFNYNAHDMLHTIQRAVRYYNEDKNLWAELRRRGMMGDYSWTHSAKEYLALYEKLIGVPAAAEKAPVAEEKPKKKAAPRKKAAPKAE